MERPWAGYIRVSDRHGREGDSYRSVIDQRKAIEAWVGGRGEDVDVLPEEENESGGRADRPILMEAVQGVVDGRYCGVVAAYQSRFMRDSVHVQLLRQKVEDAGGFLAMADSGIAQPDAKSKMIFGITGSIDQFVREEHSERFKAQGKSAVERAVYPMPIVPFGYSKDPTTRRLVPNADAAKVLKAFTDRLSDRSVADIAVDLGRSEGGVRTLLKNRVYLGELRKGENLNAAAHPAIVPLDVFDAVQALRGKRPSRAKGHAPGLVVGLIRCQGCGHMMRRCHRGTRGDGYVYECRRQSAAGRCGASASITAHIVEGFVTGLALQELERIRLRSASKTDQSLALRAALSAATKELDEYLAAVSAVDVGAEAFRAGARVRQSAVREARDALDSQVKIATVLPDIATGAKAWEQLDIQGRNTLLRGLIDAVVVKRVGPGLRHPAANRVRVFKHGTLPARSTNRAAGHISAALPFPDAGDERVIWEASAE